MNKWIVLGMGVSGIAACRLLMSKEKQVIGLDKSYLQLQKTYPELQIFPEEYTWEEEMVEGMILSPGVSLNHPQVQLAKKRGIEMFGEVAFALKFLKNRCIAITGTNGKTTVTALIAHILQNNHRKAKAVGNIGTALSEYALNPDSEELLVVELSSYQIETLRNKSFDAGLILNITPDHLDRYGNLDTYAMAKLRLQSCLKDPKQLWVSKGIIDEYANCFSHEPKNFELYAELIKDRVPPVKICLQNLCAAYSLCKEEGISIEGFIEGLKSFRKAAHRFEIFLEKDSIRYIDDSKATNVDAVCSAIEQVEGSIVLILGGVDKQGSYDTWEKIFLRKVRKIFVTGPAKERIANALQDSFSIEKMDTFSDAVMKACQSAQENDTVLLSPGCSSFDAFKNYEHRGQTFKELVWQFTGGK